MMKKRGVVTLLTLGISFGLFVSPVAVSAAFSPGIAWRCNQLVSQVWRKFSGKRIGLEETKTRISLVDTPESIAIGSEIEVAGSELKEGRHWIVTNKWSDAVSTTITAETFGDWEDFYNLPQHTYVSGLGQEFKILYRDGKQYEYIANFNHRNESVTSPGTIEGLIDEVRKGKRALPYISIRRPDGPSITYTMNRGEFAERNPLIKKAVGYATRMKLKRRSTPMSFGEFWKTFSVRESQIRGEAIGSQYPGSKFLIKTYDETTGNVTLEREVKISGVISKPAKIEGFSETFLVDEVQPKTGKLLAMGNARYSVDRLYKDAGEYRISLTAMSERGRSRTATVQIGDEYSLFTNEGVASRVPEDLAVGTLVKVGDVNYKVTGYDGSAGKTSWITLSRSEEVVVPLEQLENALKPKP